MKKVLFSTCLIAFTVLFGQTSFGQYINTAAGNGTSGYAGDGNLAVSARLNAPEAIAYDAYGTLYIADALNNVVRRVDATTGYISTFAGTGTAGFSGDGGAATAARLYAPAGLAVDGAGNVYISDQLNNRVRMVSASTGDITTVAGTGTASYSGDGGAATAATLNRPYGLALDGSGNLYIADRNNNVIRRVTTSTGVITTVAGTGTVGFSGDGSSALSANLNRPLAIAFGISGNLYFVDNGNNRVRMINVTSGIINTVAGNGTASYSGDGGAATSATLNNPYGISFDGSGNFYIADYGNSVIRAVDPSGTISTIAGTGTAGFNVDCVSPTSAQLNNPAAVTFDAPGNLTITDQSNQRIRKIIQPCSGTPVVGTAIGTVTSGCPYYASTLAITGAVISCDYNYQWQVSSDSISWTNLPGATTGNYFIAPGSSAYYRARVTCVNSGLSDTSGHVRLNVNPYPVIRPIAGATAVCVGDTTRLRDTTIFGTGAWIATNANATVDGAGLVTGVTAGLDTIIYFGTNFCGTVYDSQFVMVNPIVTPSVSISSSHGFSVCDRTSVTYTANPVNGGTSPGYRWEVNGSYAGAGRVFTYTPVNGDVITVIMLTSAPCATASTATASVTMFVTNLLVPGVVISNGLLGDSVCSGQSVTWYSAVTNGGATPSYDWRVNGSSVASTPNYTYVPSNGDVLSLTVTSSFACASPSTASTSHVITVDNVQSPFVSITAFPGDTSCVGYNVTYTAFWRYGGLTPNLLWKKNGVAVATGPSYTYMPTTGDYIQCVLYSSAPCRDADSVFSNIITMTVGPIVTAYGTISALPGVNITPGTYDTLIASVVNGGSNPTYQWYLNGTAIPGATLSYYVSNAFADMDSVYCRVHSSNVCATPDVFRTNTLVFRVSTVGVAEQYSDPQIQMVPNPSDGSFTVTGYLPAASKTTHIEVMNVVGVVVYATDVDVTNHRLQHTVTLGDAITSGQYLVKISDGQSNTVLRLIVAH